MAANFTQLNAIRATWNWLDYFVRLFDLLLVAHYFEFANNWSAIAVLSSPNKKKSIQLPISGILKCGESERKVNIRIENNIDTCHWQWLGVPLLITQRLIEENKSNNLSVILIGRIVGSVTLRSSPIVSERWRFQSHIYHFAGFIFDLFTENA